MRKAMMTALVMAAMLAGGTAWGQTKKPMPTDDKLQEIDKTIKEVYRDEYAKRGPEERLALAKRLLDDGKTTKDGPTQYGLLMEARNIAHQIGSFDVAIAAGGELGENFEGVDGFDLRMRSLTAIRPLCKTEDEINTGLQAAEGVVDMALGAENFEAAQKGLQQVIEYAKLAKNLQRVADANKRITDIRGQATAFNLYKAAEERLKSDPEDAGAKYQVGSYLCLYRGEWDRGLPLTKDGADGAWAAASKMDLANPVAMTDMLKVADLWYDIGANRELQRGRVWHRAEFWYRLILPNADGLQKTRIEKRLDEIAKAKVPMLAIISEATRKALPTDLELKRLRELCIAAKAPGAKAQATTDLLTYMRNLNTRLNNGLVEYKESDFVARCKAEMQVREVLQKNGCGDLVNSYASLHNQFVSFAALGKSRDDLASRIMAFERYNSTDKVLDGKTFDTAVRMAITNFVAKKPNEFRTPQQKAELVDFLKDRGIRSSGVDEYKKVLGNRGQ